MFETFRDVTAPIVEGAFGGIGTAIDAIQSAIDTLAGAIRSLPSPSDVIGNIPGAGLLGFSYAGRTVHSPFPTWIGEIGTEHVVPAYAGLDRIKQILGESNVLARLQADFARQQGGAGQAPVVNVTPQTPVIVKEGAQITNVTVEGGSGAASLPRPYLDDLAGRVHRGRRRR